jgi:hypothetical protein
MNKELACKRLLTRDDNYRGDMTRTEALTILRREEQWSRMHNRDHREVWELGRSAPDKLYGFTSEWDIPALLLVCREAHYVASRVYSRTFSAHGALAQTYFSYKRDTLYLDFQTIGKGFRYSPIATNEDTLAMVLMEKTVPDELARVENLAIQVPVRGGYRQHPTDDNMKEWLQRLAVIFPGLKCLTAVEVYHYEYTGYKEKYDYEDLRFMSLTIDEDGASRVNGYRVGERVKPQPEPPRLAFPRSLIDEAAQDWTAKHPDETPFRLPDIEYKLLASRYIETKLLEAAERVAKQEGRGCWYINPADPTDFEESASDELDEELESLLDWY